MLFQLPSDSETRIIDLEDPVATQSTSSCLTKRQRAESIDSIESVLVCHLRITNPSQDDSEYHFTSG
jgi:hypothetical protein